ncbi:hypothetical protein EYF80_040690 [Liparis tanakae]|uniref:Uncharacterized protein n=1 Tax=Liparis tanakae TaxID=230148 RepID=A0A4Z2G7J5_9TELE|nr:hypothetical protein EYF80_040690 [Liparis tanakae]
MVEVWMVVPPRLERICSGRKSSGVSKAKMESLSWMISRSSSSSQKERWKPSKYISVRTI